MSRVSCITLSVVMLLDFPCCFTRVMSCWFHCEFFTRTSFLSSCSMGGLVGAASSCEKIWCPPSSLPHAQPWANCQTNYSYHWWSPIALAQRNYWTYLLASARTMHFICQWWPYRFDQVSRLIRELNMASGLLRELVALCNNRLQTVHNEIVRVSNEKQRQTWV